MPPRIVLVTGSLQGGGAERVLSEMANFGVTKGWVVTFVTWGDPETDDFYMLDQEVNRVRLSIAKSGSTFIGKVHATWLRISELRKLLLDLQPDTVLSFINTSNVMTILASAGSNFRVVVSERVQPAADPTISLAWRLLRRIFYSWSDEIVVQSKDAAAWIRRYCRKSPIIIPNSIRSLPQLNFERESLIVAVGRLAHQKGFDLLLRAFARIAAEFNDWNVVIVGEGQERENLLCLRDEVALTDRVQFVGHVRDVESWMARAGLVVQPSRFEGFPNVLLESMGTGAPVVSADCPSGPGEIIQDGVNGRLVPVNNVEALAEAMRELMLQPDLRTRLGIEAQKVREKYRQDSIMELWEECLFPGQKYVQDDGPGMGKVPIERD